MTDQLRNVPEAVALPARLYRTGIDRMLEALGDQVRPLYGATRVVPVVTPDGFGWKIELEEHQVGFAFNRNGRLRYVYNWKD